MTAARRRALYPLAATAALALAGALAARVAGTAPPPLPTLPPEGGLTFDVRDADTSQSIPCKLTLLGTDGTPTPRFTHDDIGRQDGDSIVAFNRVLSVTGIGVVHVPVGTYDVYVSRGPEWDLFVARHVRIGARGATVQARLRHVVDTHGWISGDFHVHAHMSPDSRVPMRDRIYEFIADGVEVIVSTDHNVVADYAPLIQELGVGRYLTSLPGDELTTNGWGHFGAFPLPQDLERAGHGAVLVHGRGAQDFFREVRTRAPEAVIDVHHPRIDTEIGYFNVSRFDARGDRAERPGFSFDFDAIEVLNGYQDAERRSVDRVIDDWFALIAHGHIVTATGNSDTHHLDHNIGGYPRNYVRVQEDEPQRLKPFEVPRAVKAHRALFTTAPFVQLTVDKAAIGDVARVQRGQRARAEVEVQAAPWVSVSSVTLYVNGAEVKRWAVPPSTAVVRLRDGVDIVPGRDSWVVARVDGDKPLAPIVGDEKRFDVRPLALTNPVFVDVDGDGAYDPPLPHGPHTRDGRRAAGSGE
jgi:hypothetical protein